MFVETASDARTYRPKVTKTLEQARRGPSRAVGFGWRGLRHIADLNRRGVALKRAPALKGDLGPPLLTVSPYSCE
jgi:hypothetical protein